MSKFVSVTIALLAVLGLVVLCAGGLTGRQSARAAAKDEGGYKLVAPLLVIMEEGDEIFYELLDKVDAKKFRTASKEALFLAELANITWHAHYKSEEVKTAAHKKEWQKYATSVKDGLLKLSEASKKKDAKEVKSLHSKVEAACDTCHEKFRDV